MNDRHQGETMLAPLPREEADLIRVRLAAERTLLSWIRTGLALMGFGFLVARFGLFLGEFVTGPEPALSRNAGFSLWLGIALVLLGVTVTLLAAGQHYQFLRHFGLDRLRSQSRPSLGLVVALVLAALGLIMAVYLVSMG